MEKVQRMAARWTYRRWRNTSSVGEMLDELQWPTLEAQRDQSSLLFFHNIHCGIMSIDRDKYLTLSHSTISTRPSHNSQYCRPWAATAHTYSIHTDVMSDVVLENTLYIKCTFKQAVLLSLFCSGSLYIFFFYLIIKI